MTSLPIDGRSLAQKLQEAKELLVSNGYAVRGPLLTEDDIVGVANYKFPYRLRTYFFEKMAEYNPTHVFAFTGNKKEDLGIASRFLASLEDEGGVGRRQSMAQCMLLIETLFRYEHLLGLNSKITSMRVLLPGGKTGWIIDRVKSILNGIDVEATAFEDKLWYDRLYLSQEEAIHNKEESRDA